MDFGSPRFWRTGTRWAVLVSALVLAVVIVGLVSVFTSPSATKGVEKAAPVALAILALSSLILTAVSVSTAATRSKKQATIEAWNRWSDATVEHRHTVSLLLGKGDLTEDQGRAFVRSDGRVTGADGAVLSSDDQAKAGNAMVHILNGLERICVGVEMSVYDLGTLRSLGGTIVVREHRRFQTYVTERQNATGLERQARAYVSLVNVSRLLERRSLLDRREEIDRRRLEDLSRRR